MVRQFLSQPPFVLLTQDPFAVWNCNKVQQTPYNKLLSKANSEELGI